MSKNWMRHFELQVLDSKGAGLDLGDFKVTFEINWFNISSQNKLGTFRIYNLSQNTVNRIMGEEFTRIRVIAGYDGLMPVVDESEINKPREISPDEVGQQNGQNYGLIFDGEIRYAMTGKENPVDSFVLIQAADADQAFSTAMTGTTLAAGYTVADVRKALMKDFSIHGAEQGNVPATPPTVFPRGRVLFGMTRDLMNNVARQCNATWMFVDGKMEMVADDEVVHKAIDLNSDTGLIGMPQQTIGNGVNVRCLINPNIRVNGLIRLNQQDVLINRAELPAGDAQMTQGRVFEQTTNGNSTVDLPVSKSNTASIATDGVYKVIGIMYTGDTRGQAWYMDLMCEARGAQDIRTTDSLNRG